jgi:hypothetical protein
MQRRQKAYALVFFICLLSDQQVAPRSITQIASSLDDTKCVVEGRVTKIPSGEPIKGAEIVLMTDDGKNLEHSGFTDATGQFSLADIEPGRYKIMVDKTGYDSPERQCDSNNIQEGEELSLVPGQKLSGLNLQLLAPAVITGTVFDSQGEALPNAQIEARRYYAFRGEEAFSRAGLAQSDDRGKYRMFDLPRGRYYVRVGDAFYFQRQIHRIKTAGDPLGFLPTYYPGTTDLTQAVLLEVKPGEEISGVNFSVQPARVLRIRGSVVNGITGEPVRDGSVTLIRRRPAIQENGGSAYTIGRDGRFEIKDLAPGPYILSAESVDFVERRPWKGRQAIELRDAGLDDIQVKVFPGHDIAGRVQLTQNKRIEFSELQVELQPHRDSNYRSAFTEVSADGSFVLRDVPEGAYDVNVTGLAANFYLKSVRLGGVDETESGLRVSGEGSIFPLLLEVSPAGAQVEGAVETNDGKTACQATVVLVPEPDRRDIRRFYYSTDTNRSGRFVIRGVAPGNYRLFAWDREDEAAYFDSEFLRPYEKLHEPVNFEEGEHRTALLKLILIGKSKS